MRAEPSAAVKRTLPRVVVVLGVASLLHDAASEMVTPLLPVFLTAVLGAGPAIVGLVEGTADATASLVKLLSGWLADRGFSTRRLVIGGYTVSNLARPAIGFALGWALVLALRFADRIGKGIRSAPRDAWIAASSPAAIRGRAFGFHRAMDHAGAVIGPLVAFALLSAGNTTSQVFLWSAVPGALLLLALFAGLPADPSTHAVPERQRPRWRALDARLRALVIAAGALALATTPEAFLVLWATDRHLPIAQVPLLWAAASAVKMLVAVPAGVLSDRVGRLPVVGVGWLARVALLAALAFAPATPLAVWGLFIGYAASLSFTEAAERSLIGDLAPASVRGTVFGFYHLLTGLLVLPGALAFGAIWQLAGQRVAFVAAAIMTFASAAALLAISRSATRRLSRR